MERKPGLKENWRQFTLLVIVNAFVGGMVGLERSLLPQLAEEEFGLSSKFAILSFIVAFGFTKALSNYFSGRLANKLGRKNLLIMGWILALPIPFLIIYADSWNLIIFANILLGISQGLTWSSTVVMKIDLVGEKQRGLAMGINEFAGYLAVGVVAFFTGFIAENYGIRPYPFYIGIIISVLGLLLSIIWVADTSSFVTQETPTSKIKKVKGIFWTTTIKDKTLSSVTQAGLVNNLNDGMIWGLLPILLMQIGFDNQNIGIITALYPAIWGIGQLLTGKLSDIYSKKKMLFWGMILQGVAIGLLISTKNFYALGLLSAILGIGTALVYPTFLTTIAQHIHPEQRAESLGVFRLWRDMGYAIGAIISGITADVLGIQYSILLIGVLTILSAIIIHFRMPIGMLSNYREFYPPDIHRT
ncbi:MAG: MFS transporter [Bacteroidia bacterium]|nr:MFS transporter [Bacteroidia bacterium]